MSIVMRVTILAGLSFIIYLLYVRSKTRSTGGLELINSETEIPNMTFDRKSLKVKTPSPAKKDIVLAKLTGGENAILWNGVTGTSYHYSIKDLNNGLMIVNSDIIATGPVIKIKGIPIVEFNKYEVSVGDTTVSITFDPPGIVDEESDFESGYIRTTYMPTGVEILIDGVKLPDSKVGIYGDPTPGIISSTPLSGSPKEIVVMIHNGPNVVYIFSNV